MVQDFQQIIDEYSEEYCHFLEAAYGKGMLSEGGEQAVKALFDGIALDGKALLDVGFGTGGAVFYLAKEYNALVSGIEINPELVERAHTLVQRSFKQKVSFEQYQEYPKMPFVNQQFDVVYSKGILTHVEDKLSLFDEIHRVMRDDGLLVINDWLSSEKGAWSERVTKLCDIEGLTLYAESVESYVDILHRSGFELAQPVRDETNTYAAYNLEIANNLRGSSTFRQSFGDSSTDEAIHCYQLIADAMTQEELLVTRFVAKKVR